MQATAVEQGRRKYLYYAQNDDVYEAALRFVARRAVPPTTLFFVSINNEEPTSNLVQRFQKGTLKILPMSRAIGYNPHNGWPNPMLDSQTKRIGTPIKMDAVQWKNAREASVWIETRDEATHYSLQKQNGKWRVANTMTAWTRPPTFRPKATPQVLAP